MPTTAMLTMICSACQGTVLTKATKTGLPRLPRGWKRREDPDNGTAIYTCRDCQKKLYLLRTITFPVAGVLEGGSWRDFCNAVRQALFHSRTLAQWAINQLAATDICRTLDMERLPPHPPLGKPDGVYLYGLAAQRYLDWGKWEGAYTAAQAILRVVELHYNEHRKKIVWQADQSVPTIRSQPYPVPAQSWSPKWAEFPSEKTGQVTRVPAVSLPLSGRRWLLRLRGGQQRLRQLAAFAQLVSGAAERCELMLYRKRTQANRDRSGTNAHAPPGGGQQVRYDIMIGLVAWLPRRTRPDHLSRQGSLAVHSSASAFLVAVHPDFERPWMLNRDEVRRRVLQHARRLQRFREDVKVDVRPGSRLSGPWRTPTAEEQAERRRNKRLQRRRLGFLDKICQAYHCYIATFVKEAAAWLAAYAGRIGVTKVVLDLRDRRYCPGFPWATLRDRIALNLQERGIDLDVITSAPKMEEANAGTNDAPPEERQPE